MIYQETPVTNVLKSTSGEKPEFMNWPEFKRIPKHIAFIPDGNRRWAVNRGLAKEYGYAAGLDPGFQLCDICRLLGIKELTIYGFTNDNTKRPAVQTKAFQSACVEFADGLPKTKTSLLVVGNDQSLMFPRQLKHYTTRSSITEDTLKVNFLVNYDWHWDLNRAVLSLNGTHSSMRKSFLDSIGSAEISRIDLIIRWGGRKRLSGLLPVQSVYSDFFFIEELWPDFEPEQFYKALRWYQTQDVTLGG